MMNHRKKITAGVVAAAMGVAVWGCGGESESSGRASEGASSNAASPAKVDFLLASAPEGAMDVGPAKAAAEEGQEIVVRGKIGGRISPMSDESAVFMMMDLSEQSCDQRHADQCPTPWDYCCTAPEVIRALSCTVQVVDGEGRPLSIDLKESGLEPLDEVVVVGTVAPRPNEDVLIIRATGVHRLGS